MADVEKSVFATLAGLGLMTLVGQVANEFYSETEMARLRLAFSAEERERIVAPRPFAVAEGCDEYGNVDPPIRLDRLPTKFFANVVSTPASNFPADMLGKPGLRLSIGTTPARPARGVSRQ